MGTTIGLLICMAGGLFGACLEVCGIKEPVIYFLIGGITVGILSLFFTR